MDGTKQLDKEIAELKTFIADLKADRATQKEKEERESWTKYTAVSLVFVAVLAAVATQWAGKYSSRTLVELNNATFFQAEASDQWSYYQAKSIKLNLYEALPEVAPKESGGGSNGTAAFATKAAKYGKEKEEIREKAAALEKRRDAAREASSRASQRGGSMGTAVSIFQIAIALGSISLVTKKRAFWYLALIFAALATVRMVYVWMT